MDRVNLIIENGTQFRKVNASRDQAKYICYVCRSGNATVWPKGMVGSEFRKGFDSLPDVFLDLYPNPCGLSAWAPAGEV